MSIMDKKTYLNPDFEEFILAMGGVICGSPDYETTLENWTEEEIN